MLIKISQKSFNDVHLGLSFTTLFTAYDGYVNIQQILTVSIHQDNPDYNPEGFVTLGIIYTFFSLCVWLAPYFISVLGYRLTLALASTCYLSVVTFYLFENNWLTYASGAICGSAAAILWTSQGTYSVLNSENGDVHTTSCIFYIFFHASKFTGNSFTYWLFNDPNEPVNRAMRTKIAIFLGAFVVCSSVLLATLRPPIKAKDGIRKKTTFWNEIRKTFKTISHKKMLLSTSMFIFYGLLVSFLTVIPASLGFSQYLSINSKKFAPLSGLMVGCGQFIGIFLAWLMNRKPKFKCFLLPTTCLYSLIALGTLFLGLPDSSVFTYTNERPIVEMPFYIFLVASMLLAIADAVILVETFDIVGNINPSDSAPSFAMSQFIKNIASTISYFYSSYFGLQIQVFILMIFLTSTFLIHCWTWRSNSLKKVDITENTASK